MWNKRTKTDHKSLAILNLIERSTANGINRFQNNRVIVEAFCDKNGETVELSIGQFVVDLLVIAEKHFGAKHHRFGERCLRHSQDVDQIEKVLVIIYT